MEIFYRYSYAMPFFHNVTASKYIFWGARNRLGLNFGVLVAWIALNHVSLIAFVWNARRVAHKERKEVVDKELSEEGKAGRGGEA